jgi:PAS domain S-box-containing protein
VNIDLRTLALMFGLMNVLMALAIYIPFLWNKAYRGISWWLLWAVTSAGGLVAMLLRDYLPAQAIAASIFLANALFFTGQVFLYTGTMRFLDRRENRWIIIGVAVLFTLSTLYVMLISGDVNARAVVLYITSSLFVILSALGLFTYSKPAYRGSAQFIAAVLLMQGVYFLLRSVAAVTVAPVESVFTPSLLQSATFLVTLVFGSLLMAGLIVMVFQRANAEIKESKEQIEFIFNMSPAAVVIMRKHDNVIVEANEAFSTLTGFSRKEVAGQSPAALKIWENAEVMIGEDARLFPDGSNRNSAAVLRMKDGSRIHVIMLARAVSLQGVAHIIVTINDITERKLMEEEQQRVLKLEALGQMAGGIAGDFDALLKGILGNISLARLEAPNGSVLHDRLLRSEKEVLKANELTGQLSAFSSAVGPVKQTVDIRDLVRDTAGFTMRHSGTGCEINLAPGLWKAEIDRGQVSQAMYNLIRWTSQNLHPGEDMKISAGNITLDDKHVAGINPPLPKGDYVKIDIAGCSNAMTAGQMAGIFDPFTPAGMNSGLGLAVAFAIARQHGGHLSMQSTPEGGTTFSLLLPALAAK